MVDDSGKDSSPGTTGSINIGVGNPCFANTGTINGDVTVNVTAKQEQPGFTLHIPTLPSPHQPRHKEIEEFKKLIKDAGSGSHVFACVRGWPGSGKSAFLAELAYDREIQSSFNKRILWITLGQEPDIGYQLRHCAGKLGIIQETLKDLSHNEIKNRINGKLIEIGEKFLIFIDDVWEKNHYELFKFGNADCVTVVATRRKDVAEEVSSHQTYKLDDMTAPDSIALMKKLAPKVMEKHQTGCEELLNRLGRLPLIITIVGRLLNVAHGRGRDVSKKIDDLILAREKLLDQKVPGDMEPGSKEQVVSMLIDKSLACIEKVDDRRYFAMLSVFGEKPIHYGLDAIKAVWGVEDPEPVKDQLVDLGLLELESEGKPRYQMHALLVQYGYQLLKLVTKQHPEELRVPHIRHADHYRKVLSALDNLFLKGNESMMQALSAFDNLEWPNIQRAQQWAKGNWKKQDDSANLAVAEILADFPNAGAYILNLRLHNREWIKWHESALSAIEEIIKNESGEAKSKANGRKGNLLGNLGLAYASLGEYRKAIEYYEQALEIALEIGDRRGEGHRLGNLGGAYLSLGEYRKAIEYFEQALGIAREIGDRRLEGNTLGNLGNAYFSLGEYRKAIEYHEQVLRISREIGNRQGEGNTLGNLGNAYAHLGEYHKAIEYQEQALTISRETGAKELEGNACHNLVEALDKIGKTEEALGYADLAVEIFESIESPNAEVARKQRDYLKNKLGK